MKTASEILLTMNRYVGGDTVAEAVADCKDAISNSLATLFAEHDWPWYKGQHVLLTSAPYETGTVTFTASNLQVTLTGGTWPTWANYGYIVINGILAKVVSRVSNTVITIESGTELNADIVSATAYRLLRCEYPIPSTIRKISNAMFQRKPLRRVAYTEPNNFRTSLRYGVQVSVPEHFTVIRDRNITGGLIIVLWPIPSTAEEFRFNYVREPNPIVHWGESDGSVSVNGTAITGSNTNFKSSMVGAMIRISKNNLEIPQGPNEKNPFEEEAIISSVTNTTTAVAMSSFSNLPNRKYEISTILDIDPIMLEALQAKCYLSLSIRRRMEARMTNQAAANYGALLRQAKLATVPSTETNYAGSWYTVNNDRYLTGGAV